MNKAGWGGWEVRILMEEGGRNVDEKRESRILIFEKVKIDGNWRIIQF